MQNSENRCWLCWSWKMKCGWSLSGNTVLNKDIKSSNLCPLSEPFAYTSSVLLFLGLLHIFVTPRRFTERSPPSPRPPVLTPHAGAQVTAEWGWWTNLANSHLLPAAQLCSGHRDISLLNMTADIQLIPAQRSGADGGGGIWWKEQGNE